MRGTMLIIRASGARVEVTRFNREVTLDELKTAIGGGYIEAVPHFRTIKIEGRLRPCWAICDEDGKLKNLPYNDMATAIWNEAFHRLHGISTYPDYLVGDVAVLYGDRKFMEAL